MFLQAPQSSDQLCASDSSKSSSGESGKNVSLEWFIEPSEEKGFFHLVSASDPKRPMLLHIGENFEQNGDPITLVERNHAFENTKLHFDEVPGLDGYYFMTFYKASNMASRTTDSKRVVHVDENTKMITQWEKIPSPSCYWRFIPARLSPADLIASGEHNCFAIENKSGGFLLLKGGSIFNGTQVTSGPFANQTNYKWRIKCAGDDQYFIISARDAHHDRVLQQHDDSPADGAKITLWEVDPDNMNKACMMVKFEPAQDEFGDWCILFCHSNKYMQMRLGEVSQMGKRRNQSPEPSMCWTFVRCIPNFPKNA
jgi:hypothetical protein